MPAEVETMAYNLRNGIPWHQLGKPIDGTADAETMQKEAGLLWEVAKQPILVNGVGALSSQLIAASVPTGKMVTVRSSDSRPLGVVGSTYQPIQNTELFEFAEALVGTGEGVRFETAGSLQEGRIVWALASIPDRAIRIDGDNSDIMPYLVLSTGHDGLRAFMASFTPVRVVCSNTLAMAMKGAREAYTIRHTVRAMDKVEQAKKALRVNVEYLETLRAVSNQLMKRKVSIKDVRAFTETLIPSLAEEPERAVKVQKQRDEIIALFQNSQNLVDVPQSAYRLLQATAEWVDHSKVYRATKKGTAQDARALAILDGTGSLIKERALSLLLPAAAKRTPSGRFAAKVATE